MASTSQSDVKVKCEASLDVIKSTIQQSEEHILEQIEEKVENVRNQLNSEQNLDTIQIATTVLERVGSNMSKLRSGNPMDIMSALFDILSKSVTLVPIIGPLISKVFGLLSYVLGMYGDVDKSMSSIIEKIVREALNEFEDKLLSRKAFGIKRAFSVSNAFLSGMDGGSDINFHEMAALGGCVPVYQGVKFLGILGSKLKENTLIDGQHVKAMTYIKMYCELAFLRYSVLYQMYSVARSTGHSQYTAKSIMKVIEIDKQEDRSVLRFLTQPEKENIFFFARTYLFEEKWRTVQDFMTFIDLQFQNLSFLAEGEYHMRPLDWEHSKVYINWAKVVAAHYNPGDQGKIYFTRTEEENVFYIKTRAYPETNIYMKQDTCGFLSGTTVDADGAEKWKVIKLQDGTYMLSTKKWPGWFMYMVNTCAGWVRGSNGVPPGKQGNWMIESFC